MHNRTVHRRVQGVDLYLPWSHYLPDYARKCPWYGQNLVRLAEALERRSAEGDGPLTVLDIGANVGDSAAQIMAATGAHVLCVEADPYWIGYLEKNLGADGRATIVQALLVVDEDAAYARPVRTHGTTHFVESDADGSAPQVSVGALRTEHPGFDRLRLVKSDTDGFDTTLVPAVADAWADTGPVLFFEFDPVLTRTVAGVDPNAMWEQLAALGYERLAIWDNGGDPLGQLDLRDAAATAASLEPRPVEYGYDFWDVAACRGSDDAAKAAFDELMPEPFSVRGSWRERS
jgi:FkbM family methyltransferase